MVVKREVLERCGWKDPSLDLSKPMKEGDFWSSLWRFEEMDKKVVC